jgi:hypothetical protein
MVQLDSWIETVALNLGLGFKIINIAVIDIIIVVAIFSFLLML